MGSITCLVLSEEEKKNEGWRRLLEERQTEEEGTGGLHLAKLSGNVGAYGSLQALIITQQCPRLIDSYYSTAAFHLITSWMTSLWGIQQMPIAGRPSCFFYAPQLAFLPLSAGELLSLQRSKSRGASLLSAADEGPTGNHQRPLYEAVWRSEWTQRPAILLQAMMIIGERSQAWLYTRTMQGKAMGTDFTKTAKLQPCTD